MRARRLLVLTAMMLVPALADAAPAFDCARASGQIERLICSDEALGAMDRKLDEVYTRAAATLKSPDQAAELRRLQATQRGWIKSRNDCWKAEDQRRCVQDCYEVHSAELQVRYRLIAAGPPSSTSATATPAPGSWLSSTTRITRPSAWRAGNQTVIGVLGLSGSGARYVADPGIIFRVKGREAFVEWPEGTRFTCRTTS